ncbi:NAD-dependent epimerase/dehydratase family protein [Halobacillus sp. HZG1]|uniref:NAD-dependent epimerase/dehydratase family protein n=1 Tax=Halobacillus sp. HZG1 TaxID=3111769 RepID=UPI002DB89093|nr:NAD-dependent epimerase/dehydratase family protein [Halobacillus sp. HZG1]MEC3883974.1 NAD-dependent epimerase/dehydratase family protein [Halobacillus sp. HZG1]
MKVLVTGGAGFIGSHIVDELLFQHFDVVIVDNLSTGREENIPGHVTHYNMDLRDSLDLVFANERPDIVIHQAAQVSVAHSMKNPGFDAEENIKVTVNLLESCVKYGVTKFIFASSAAVYGAPAYLPIDENHPIDPSSFYGLSKRSAETYIEMFSQTFDLNYTILRYSNVYGMRQNTEGEAGVVALFIDQALKGETLSVFGDGLQTRDFIFVKDVAKANVAACLNGDRETINISQGIQTSILELIKALYLNIGDSIQPSFYEERTGDIRHSLLSNKKAKQLLEWEPFYTLSEGLKLTIEHSQNHKVHMYLK